MNISKFLFGGLVLVLAGCASSQRSARARWEDMHVDMAYTGALLKYTCGYRGNHCGASPLEGYSKESPAPAVQPSAIRQKPGRVKAYKMGRYVDQSGRVHEAGTVYRVESGRDWGAVAKSVSSTPSLVQPVVGNNQNVASVRQSDQSSEVSELRQKIDVLEEVLKRNAANVNANQTLLVSQINDLKSQLAAMQGKQVSANVPAQ